MEIKLNGSVLGENRAIWKDGELLKPPEGEWVLVCFEQESRVKPAYAIMQVDEEGTWWNWDNTLDVEDKQIFWTELPEISRELR